LKTIKNLLVETILLKVFFSGKIKSCGKFLKIHILLTVFIIFKAQVKTFV